MALADLKAGWVTFVASRRGRVTLKALRVLFTLGIAGYLFYELSRIGWEAIWTSLPTHPLFYVLFLLLYFSLPLSEILIYRISWAFEAWRSAAVFIKKRIYNKEVLGYSGEVYFYAWARKHVALPDREVLKTVRDNNIISSVASTLVAVGLLAVFLYEGRIGIGEWIGRANGFYLVGGGVLAALLVLLAVRFRRYLFSMAPKTALVIFAIQCVRLLLGQALQIAQWAVAMPEVSLEVWFTFSAASIIVSRIPILPSRDLLFLGAGVGLSQRMSLSSADVTGMLLTITVLGKALNALLFALFSASDWRRARGLARTPRGAAVGRDAVAQVRPETGAEEPADADAPHPAAI